VIARATIAEVDPVRLSIGEAIELFRSSVVPELHEQDGYEGAYVLLTPEGKALVLTFWADDESAQAGLQSGFYAQQVEKFVTVFGSGPGRETYEVVLADAPALTAG
jgi:heme-degrading monooxygenase HmoA